jgi:hypothetical protein
MSEVPTDSVKKKEHLVEGLFSHIDPPKPTLDMNWAYCAETAAASKLYLWRNGTLAFV